MLHLSKEKSKHYSSSPPPLHFFADGNVWTLGVLDYETQDNYNISVIARDAGDPSLSSTTMLYVRVLDTVDIVPDFSKSVFTLEVAENTSPGTTVYKLDSGSDKFYYSVEGSKIFQKSKTFFLSFLLPCQIINHSKLHLQMMVVIIPSLLITELERSHC